jgi:hypothetical protein
MQHQTHPLVYIDADVYFDAAESIDMLEDANSGKWDVLLGLELEAASSNIDVLAFRVVDHHKFIVANLKYGLHSRHNDTI